MNFEQYLTEEIKKGEITVKKVDDIWYVYYKDFEGQISLRRGESGRREDPNYMTFDYIEWFNDQEQLDEFEDELSDVEEKVQDAEGDWFELEDEKSIQI